MAKHDARHDTGDNVIPFRPRPPSEGELDAYRSMTRNWHPQLRQLMFPRHAAQDAPPVVDRTPPEEK